jgi:hypothetical protein
MKVVKSLQNEDLNKETSETPDNNHSGFIRMKKFHFVMQMLELAIEGNLISFIQLMIPLKQTTSRKLTRITL